MSGLPEALSLQFLLANPAVTQLIGQLQALAQQTNVAVAAPPKIATQGGPELFHTLQQLQQHEEQQSSPVPFGGAFSARTMSTASTKPPSFVGHTGHTHSSLDRSFSSSTHSSKGSRSVIDVEEPTPLPRNKSGHPMIPRAADRTANESRAVDFLIQGFERYVNQSQRFRARKGGSVESRGAAKVHAAQDHNDAELRDKRKFTEHWDFDRNWFDKTNQVDTHLLLIRWPARHPTPRMHRRSVSVMTVCCAARTACAS